VQPLAFAIVGATTNATNGNSHITSVFAAERIFPRRLAKSLFETQYGQGVDA
jgi:hypothetical protein